MTWQKGLPKAIADRASALEQLIAAIESARDASATWDEIAVVGGWSSKQAASQWFKDNRGVKMKDD